MMVVRPLCLLLLCVPQLRSVAARGWHVPPGPSVPHLTGTMIEVYYDSVSWSQGMWKAELQTMLSVGIRQLTLRSTMDGFFPNISAKIARRRSPSSMRHVETAVAPSTAKSNSVSAKANCTPMVAFYPSDASRLPKWSRPCVTNAAANARARDCRRQCIHAHLQLVHSFF